MKLAIAALFVSSAFGQAVYRFAQADSPASFQEMANIIRTAGDIKDVSVDVEARSLTVDGSVVQLGIASWLFTQLDQSSNAGMRVYQIPGSDEAIHVYYLAHLQAPAAIQELINVLRTTPDINRVFPYLGCNAVTVRATPDRVAVADWLVQKLDVPAGVQTVTGPQEFKMPPQLHGDDQVRVFYLSHMDSPQSFQQLINITRTMADLNRVFPFNQAWALVARGTPERIAMTAWLVDVLDRPAGTADTAKHEFRLAPTNPTVANDSIGRVFFLTNQPTPQDLQALVNSLRTTAHLYRVFPFAARSAVALRGNDTNLPQVEALISSADSRSAN